MNVREGKLNTLFNWVYIMMVTNALWILGVIIGLGFFSIIPSTITIMDIYQQFDHPRKRDRLKPWSFWKEHFFIRLRENWRLSFLFSLLFVILFINYGYFNLSSSLFSYFLFYITILLIFVVFLIGLWFCYIRSYYKDLNWKETLMNAVAYPVSHLVEMLIMVVLLAAAFLLIWEITPGLIVFTGMGGAFAFVHYVFTHIQNGSNLREFSKDIWERMF